MYPSPLPFDPYRLGELLSRGELPTIESDYPPLYGGLGSDEKLQFVRHLREHGFTPPVVAAVMGVNTHTSARYIRQCGASEPEHLIGVDGKTRRNPQHGVHQPHVPLTRVGRPIEARPDLLLKEARLLARRMRASPGIRSTMGTADEAELESLVESIHTDWNTGHA